MLGLCVAVVALPALVSGCGGGMSGPQPNQLRVACLGDSITLGDHTSDPSDDAYPSVIRRWLGAGYYVQNFGVAGTTLLTTRPTPYQKTKAYSRALELKPDILVVALGTVDASGDLSAATDVQFQSDYRSLIRAFKAANANVKVYPCLPPPRFISRNAELTSKVLPLIRRVAQDEGLQLIDFNTPLSDHPELFSDGLHPDTRGARILAAQVYRALTGQQPPA